MFLKLITDEYPCTFINVNHIEAISFTREITMIKFHLTSGKEFKSYIGCLEELGKLTNQKFRIKE